MNSPSRGVSKADKDQVFDCEVRRGVRPVDVALFADRHTVENLGRAIDGLAGQLLSRGHQQSLLVRAQVDLPQAVVGVGNDEVVALRIEGQSQRAAAPRLLIDVLCKKGERNYLMINPFIPTQIPTAGLADLGDMRDMVGG